MPQSLSRGCFKVGWSGGKRVFEVPSPPFLINQDSSEFICFIYHSLHYLHRKKDGKIFGRYYYIIFPNKKFIYCKFNTNILTREYPNTQIPKNLPIPPEFKISLESIFVLNRM